MTIDDILDYIHPACTYAKTVKRSSAHEICSGQIIQGKVIIACHCDCHTERKANDN